jgi:uncharacterized protein
MRLKPLVVSLFFAFALFAQTPASDAFARKLITAANDRPNHPARYDPGYVKISYPNGDVPADTGVCSDEIIRIYRAVGIDLQKEVHEDMVANPSAYPHKAKWRQLRLDTNIDHRRVPNLAVYFARKGQSLSTTDKNSFTPGDIVVWQLPNGRDHIGMVVDKKSLFGTYLAEHNIGEGPKIENVLFDWKITGHYRYRRTQ